MIVFLLLSQYTELNFNTIKFYNKIYWYLKFSFSIVYKIHTLQNVYITNFWIQGRKKPAVDEVNQSQHSIFNPSLFGCNLVDVMEIQAEKFVIVIFWIV